MNYISMKPSGLIGTEVIDVYYQQYFDWLCDKLNVIPGKYDILLWELYSIDFEWVIDLDTNRGEDGLVLRGEFHSNSDVGIGFDAGKPCSVLEALIGLASNMDYLLDNEDKGDRTRIWFWEMIANLGLDKYTDASFSKPFGRDMKRLNEIRNICSRWLKREFEYNGFGSPFPLSNPHEDQRKLHMIFQLNQYILEHYMYEDELL